MKSGKREAGRLHFRKGWSPEVILITWSLGDTVLTPSEVILGTRKMAAGGASVMKQPHTDTFMFKTSLQGRHEYPLYMQEIQYQPKERAELGDLMSKPDLVVHK